MLEETVDGAFGDEGEVGDCFGDGGEEAAEFLAYAFGEWGQGFFEEEREAEGFQAVEEACPVSVGDGFACYSAAAEICLVCELVVELVEALRMVLEFVCRHELRLLVERKRVGRVAALLKWVRAERYRTELPLYLHDDLPRLEDLLCDIAVVFEVVPAFRFAHVAK